MRYWWMAGLILVIATAVAADAVPWRRRRRGGDVRVNHLVAERVLPEDWPAEPDSPRQVDPERFAEAYRELCGWMPPERPRLYGDWILQYAAEFGEDPFLLASLTFRLGRCNARAEEMNGVGLTLIPRDMYAEHLRRGEYHFWVKRDGEWLEQVKPVGRFPFAGPRLLRPEENIYFGAAILSAWREQHQTVDEAFDQREHRHYVSHFIWGDSVRSDRAEDRVLTDRRRLLQYYGAVPMPPPISYMGLELGVPLDGSPRVVSSYIGADREGGVRQHRGIDVESVLGEPVRAVADGRVNFAGVDWPGHRSHEAMSRAEIEAVPRDQLGSGGRYVCILHRPSEGYLRSCYMHLEDVEVENGQEVHRGDRIGTVGRTGMQTSAPHLHFELHSPDGLVDGSEVLRGPLIGRPTAAQ